jgi:hypothetical protein
MLYLIYALLDPREQEPGAVGYVGCTTQSLNMRLYQHMKDKKTSRKAPWVQQLLDAGVEPKVKFLEFVDGDGALAEEREKYWIRYYLSLGAPLTNYQFANASQSDVVLPVQEQQIERQEYPVCELVAPDASFVRAYGLEYELYGLADTYWFDKVGRSWLQKNNRLYWMIGDFGYNPRWDVRGVDHPGPETVLASLCILPLEKDVIYRLLRGEMSIGDIEQEDILSYEQGKVYSCFLYVTCRPGKEQHLDKLLEYSLASIALLNVEIEELYAFATPPVNGTEKTPLFSLVEKCYFSPLELDFAGEDMKTSAWVLPMARSYQPHPAIRVYRGHREYSHAIARLVEKLKNDPAWQDLPELGEELFEFNGDSE